MWLDPRYTSPYKFYQFWLNVSDEDAERYIKIFTSMPKEEIEALIAEHKTAPHLRALQKRLAKEVTVMVHSEDDYNAAVEASGILFGNATSDALKRLDEDTLLSVFEGVPQFEVAKTEIEAGIKAVDLMVEKALIFPSKGEMRKLVQGGGVSLNKEKLAAVRMEPIGEFYNKWRAIECLEAGEVVILSGGMGNPFFTTDTGSSLRGIEIEADVMLKGTRVDGIYTADPEKDPTATKFPDITYDEVLLRGLRVMDLTATCMCKENNLPSSSSTWIPWAI